VGKTVRIRRPEDVSIRRSHFIDDFTYISSGRRLSAGYCHHRATKLDHLAAGSGHLTMGDFVGIFLFFFSLLVMLLLHVLGLLRGIFGSSSCAQISSFGGKMGLRPNLAMCACLGVQTLVLPGVTLPQKGLWLQGRGGAIDLQTKRAL